jgi:hypothetical protein
MTALSRVRKKSRLTVIRPRVRVSFSHINSSAIGPFVVVVVVVVAAAAAVVVE